MIPFDLGPIERLLLQISVVVLLVLTMAEIVLAKLRHLKRLWKGNRQ
jgi:hypothetical protein